MNDYKHQTACCLAAATTAWAILPASAQPAPPPRLIKPSASVIIASSKQARDEIVSIARSADGGELIAASKGGSVTLVDGESFERRWHWTSPTEISKISLSYDGSTIAVLGRREMGFLDAGGQPHSTTIDLPDRQAPTVSYPKVFMSMAWSPAGEWIATGDSLGFLDLWRLGQIDPLVTDKISDVPIKHLFSTDDGRFLIATTKEDVLFWSLESQEVVFRLDAHLTNSLYIRDVTVPAEHLSLMVITAYMETLVFHVAERRIVRRFPTPKLMIHDAIRAGLPMRGALHHALSQDLAWLYRAHGTGHIDRVDLETGRIDALYLDKDLVSESLPGRPIRVNGITALIPLGAGKIAAGSRHAHLDTRTGSQKAEVGLRLYELGGVSN